MIKMIVGLPLPITMPGVLLVALLLLNTCPALAVQNLTRAVCTSAYTANTAADWLHIACPGGVLIYVLRAVYGKSKTGRCAFTQGDTCVHNSLYSVPIVACFGRPACSIPTRPIHLARCGEQSDYLQVDYQCIADDVSSRFDICGGRPGVGASNPGVTLVKVGHIMTPNFPSSYPGRVHCDCLITAAIPVHTRIELELLDFRLQASPGCEYDFVEVLHDGRNADRLCGGIGRWARRTINSTWARLRLQTDNDNEFRGFWIRVWARTMQDTMVPVTVTCKGHLTPVSTPSLPPPSGKEQESASAMPPSAKTTSDGRHIWLGTLPPVESTIRYSAQNAPKNTGIIIGVCVAGVVTMVIINVVGIIICRRNMKANRSKRAVTECVRSGPDPGADSSISSLDTEYVSLNAHGATYHGTDLYSTPADDKVTIERTPGVGQTNVKPSSYDYGMLPQTYTRKAHTIASSEPIEGEDPYAVLRDHTRNSDVLYMSARRLAAPSKATYDDYEDIDAYPATAVAPQVLRASARSTHVPNGMGIQDRCASNRASINSRLSVLTHHSDMDADRGRRSDLRSPASGSSGHTSNQSVEEMPPILADSIIPYGKCGASDGMAFKQGSECIGCEDSYNNLDGVLKERTPTQDIDDTQCAVDMVEYAHSEASTTRSEYL